MRLLLDAMYSPDVAVRLRARGHDAVAIGERPELVPMDDSELLTAMAAEERTIVTTNVFDFVPLYRQALADGAERAELFLTAGHSIPLTAAGIGRFVRLLEEVLEEPPGASGEQRPG